MSEQLPNGIESVGGADDGRQVDAHREWLTIPEAAEFVGVSVRRMTDWALRGTVEAYAHRAWGERKIRLSSLLKIPHQRTKLREHYSVYFIQSGPEGAIKIGIALDAEQRRHDLQCGNPHELNLLLVTREVSEQQMHDQFEHLRVRGEWFTPARELLDFIDRLSAEEAA